MVVPGASINFIKNWTGMYVLSDIAKAIYILFRNEIQPHFTDLYIIVLILIFAKLMLSDSGKGLDLQCLLKISPCSFISFILGECYVRFVNLRFHCSFLHVHIKGLGIIWVYKTIWEYKQYIPLGLVAESKKQQWKISARSLSQDARASHFL